MRRSEETNNQPKLPATAPSLGKYLRLYMGKRSTQAMAGVDPWLQAASELWPPAGSLSALLDVRSPDPPLSAGTEISAPGGRWWDGMLMDL